MQIKLQPHHPWRILIWFVHAEIEILNLRRKQKYMEVFSRKREIVVGRKDADNARRAGGGARVMPSVGWLEAQWLELENFVFYFLNSSHIITPRGFSLWLHRLHRVGMCVKQEETGWISFPFYYFICMEGDTHAWYNLLSILTVYYVNIVRIWDIMCSHFKM